jgi:hypothetical protein
MKYLVVLLFVLILAALAWAGLSMLRNGRNGAPNPHRMARALAWRVALSALAFALIWLSYAMGWIHPTGIPLHR